MHQDRAGECVSCTRECYHEAHQTRGGLQRCRLSPDNESDHLGCGALCTSSLSSCHEQQKHVHCSCPCFPARRNRLGMKCMTHKLVMKAQACLFFWFFQQCSPHAAISRLIIGTSIKKANVSTLSMALRAAKVPSIPGNRHVKSCRGIMLLTTGGIHSACADIGAKK